MTEPGAGIVPTTPLLRYFRETLCTSPRGREWGLRRIAESEAQLADPGRLARDFHESVEIIEREYRNYQPFHPTGHAFGERGSSGIRHGDELARTVDVAARLARRDVWQVDGNPKLDFRYIDREVPLARAKPKPKQDQGALLEVDLFLANDQDRTPILAEVKIGTDECPFFALIQLLTQAAYAVTPSQRARLVLFGSRPEFVLKEAVDGKPAKTDLYVMLVNPPDKRPYGELRERAMELSKKLIKQPEIASRIRRIAWIEGVEAPPDGLALKSIT
jgi:hypothetical protein